MIKETLNKEILRFILVGGMAVFIDALSYYLLNALTQLEPANSKRLSFLMGSVWAFIMNKFYTFEQRQLNAHEPVFFAVVYLLGFLLNSIIHDTVLELLQDKAIAFVLATGVSTCTNFMGQKWIVFRKKGRAYERK